MKRNCFYIWFLGIILSCEITVSAQLFETRVTVLSAEDSTVRVAGKVSDSQKRWSFIDSYANAANLAARISDLKFVDQENNEISFIAQGAGKFETQSPAKSFSYELKLRFPKTTAQAAHVSWLTKERGLFMLADLLPDVGDEITTGKVIFDLPPNWKVATSENKLAENEFVFAEPSSSVFFVGEFNEQNSQFEKTSINLAQVGEWSFSSEETLEFAVKILAAHQKTCGAIAVAKIQILLVPFEQKFGGELWEAETRGATVVLLAAQIPFKSRALSKLHEQLRHELFHLWMPNSLNLKGDYAWFYEGFTLYHALKTGVRLKYIRFEDYLDVLSRAFDATRQNPNSKTLSLLEASRLRWRGNLSEFVYAKGMTTAFLCDLAILQKTSGKKSLDSVFQQLYSRHRKPNAPQDANQIVLGFLKKSPELRLIIEKRVETQSEIDWSPDLAAVGLKNVSKISLTRLAVSDRLNPRQKKLLAQLGAQTIEN